MRTGALRKLVVATALAVALGGEASAGTASADTRCGGPIVAEYVDTSRVRVVRRPSRVVVACDKRTGRRIALGGSPGHLTEFAGPHALDVRGDYVAWGVIEHDDGIDGDATWLPDVRSVRLSDPARALRAESQREDTSGALWAIADVVVGGNGAVAWTACRAARVRPGDPGSADADRCVPSPSEVSVSAKGRRSAQVIELARGAGIQPRSLRRSPTARTFSWRDGTRHVPQFSRANTADRDAASSRSGVCALPHQSKDAPWVTLESCERCLPRSWIILAGARDSTRRRRP
jgi:hypothetical protein